MIRLEPIRYTPAGIPLLSFVLQHASEQLEAGLKRKVECEVNAVALGNMAKTQISLGALVRVHGFLAKHSTKSTQIVMHITNLEHI